MKSQDIRNKWIEFFEKKEHLYLPSASLIPDNPTLLLNNAGMVPFVPYFLGQETPPSERIVTINEEQGLYFAELDMTNRYFSEQEIDLMRN